MPKRPLEPRPFQLDRPARDCARYGSREWGCIDPPHGPLTCRCDASRTEPRTVLLTVDADLEFKAGTNEEFVIVAAFVRRDRGAHVQSLQTRMLPT